MKRKLDHWLKRIEQLPFHWRTLIGFGLLIGGLFWFLPVLGIWMIPLGLLVLSLNFTWARRSYLRTVVWWRKFKRQRAKRQF